MMGVKWEGGWEVKGVGGQGGAWGVGPGGGVVKGGQRNGVMGLRGTGDMGKGETAWGDYVGRGRWWGAVGT